VVAAVVGQLLVRPGPDVSWLLYATREMLHGARLGVEFLEVTPPMVFLVMIPVVWLAELMGVGMWQAWVSSTVIVTVGTLLLARRLLPWPRDDERVGTATAAIAFLLLVLPGVDFGQKEHLTAVLILPYVLVSSRRLSREPVSSWLAGLAGVMGGIAIGTKPHFFLVFSGVLALEALRLGRLLWVEHLGLVIVGVVYVTLVGVLAPGYFTYALEYGGLYQSFLSKTVWETVVFGDGTLPGLIAIGVFMVLRRYVLDPKRAIVDVFAVAATAFYIAAILQGKGWRYHFLPSVIIATLLLGALLSSKTWRLPMLHRWYHGMAAATLGATVVAPLPSAAWRLLAPSSSFHDADPNFSALMPFIREAGEGVTVAVISSNIASAFPLILESGARWPLRFPSLWPLIALYDHTLDWDRVIEPRTPDMWVPLERSFVDAVYEDLEKGSPELVIVLQSDPSAIGWGGARHFDYLRYFKQDARFGDFFSRYRYADNIGDYALFRRGTDGLSSNPSDTRIGQAVTLGQPQERTRARVAAWVLTLVGAGLGFWGSWRTTGVGPSNSAPAKPPPSS
jgi:hypothetical protein